MVPWLISTAMSVLARFCCAVSDLAVLVSVPCCSGSCCWLCARLLPHFARFFATMCSISCCWVRSLLSDSVSAVVCSGSYCLVRFLGCFGSIAVEFSIFCYCFGSDAALCVCSNVSWLDFQVFVLSKFVLAYLGSFSKLSSSFLACSKCFWGDFESVRLGS